MDCAGKRARPGMTRRIRSKPLCPASSRECFLAHLRDGWFPAILEFRAPWHLPNGTISRRGLVWLTRQMPRLEFWEHCSAALAGPAFVLEQVCITRRSRTCPSSWKWVIRPTDFTTEAPILLYSKHRIRFVPLALWYRDGRGFPSPFHPPTFPHRIQTRVSIGLVSNPSLTVFRLTTETSCPIRSTTNYRFSERSGQIRCLRFLMSAIRDIDWSHRLKRIQLISRSVCFSATPQTWRPTARCVAHSARLRAEDRM